MNALPGAERACALVSKHVSISMVGCVLVCAGVVERGRSAVAWST